MSTRSMPDSTTIDGGTVLNRLADQFPGRHVRTVAFWIAVALPFLHVPLLLAGLGSPPRLQAYLGLLATNVVALGIGHDHGR